MTGCVFSKGHASYCSLAFQGGGIVLFKQYVSLIGGPKATLTSPETKNFPSGENPSEEMVLLKLQIKPYFISNLLSLN